MFIPPEVVQEVSELPPEIASNISALAFDLVGRWTGLNMLVDARLHHRMIQYKLTPNLAASSKSVEDEVKLAIEAHFPKDTDEWVEMTPYFTFMRMASRISGRVCKSSLNWTIDSKTSADHAFTQWSVNLGAIEMIGWSSPRTSQRMVRQTGFDYITIADFETVLHSIIRMRFFPTWMYPILSYLLPSCYATKRNILQAQDILSPAFAAKLKEQDEGTYQSTADVEPNGIEWLVELAKGEERE